MRLQVGKQNAAECMPLIMEPLSAFYSSPLVVLDFQSLYPSIMIAYNYCYSTCLGRITDFKGTYKFGVTDLRQPAGLLDTLQDHINGESSSYVRDLGTFSHCSFQLRQTGLCMSSRQSARGCWDVC